MPRPSPPRRRVSPARERLSRLVLVGFAALALASAGIGAARIWPHLSTERARYAHLSARQAARQIWQESPLSPALFDFYRSRLRRGDRYYVQARPASDRALDRPLLIRAFSAYWLLPAIEVRSPGDADAIVSYRADPRRLPFRYAAIARYPGGLDASVARIAR